MNNFNPRTHRGVRLFTLLFTHYHYVFQSTHPSWGATLYVYEYPPKKDDFNPRTHRGVRHKSKKIWIS